ncbi:MAG: carboxypeptidase regulatory-like domain-containing protein [Deltaproteobacteria bacterium]|nr:carboxypeptidase regulatory-like domain-containing protein [Deltaproteobacteria bacterium]
MDTLRKSTLALACALAACSSTTTNPVVNHGSIAGAAKFSGETGDQSGITVTLAGASPGATATDASGGYSFTGLAPGTYFVTAASADSLEAAVYVKVDVAKDQSVTAPALALSPAGSVSGKVLLGGSDNAGAQVAVLGTTLSATSKTDGSFSLSGVPAGAARLVLSHAGFGAAAVDVTITRGHTADAGSTTLTALSGSALIQGKVVDGNASGVGSVSVLLTGSETGYASTDSSGNFAFNQLSGGTYRLSIGGPDVTPHETDLDVTVAAGATKTVANTVVHGVGSIAGTVDTAGLASKLPAVAILSQSGSPQGATALVSATGAFLLRDVPAGTGYTVSVSGGGAVTPSAAAPEVVRGQTSIIATAFVLSGGSGGASVDLRGRARIVGQGDADLTNPPTPGGIQVSVRAGTSTAQITTTANDGTWASTVPGGSVDLALSKEDFSESVSGALAIAGTHGLALDGVPYPLDSELELQGAPRILSSPRVSAMCPRVQTGLSPTFNNSAGLGAVTFLADYECPSTLIGIGQGPGTRANPIQPGTCLTGPNDEFTGARRLGGGNPGNPQVGEACTGRLVMVTSDGRSGVIPDWPILEGTYTQGPGQTVYYFTAFNPAGNNLATLRLAVLPPAPAGAQVDPDVYTIGTSVLVNSQVQFFDSKMLFLANRHLAPDPQNSGSTMWVGDATLVDTHDPAHPLTVASGIRADNPQLLFSAGGGYVCWYDASPSEGPAFTRCAPSSACTREGGCTVSLTQARTPYQMYFTDDDSVVFWDQSDTTGTLEITALDGSGTRNEPLPTGLSYAFANPHGIVYRTNPNPGTDPDYRWWITPASAAASSTRALLLDQSNTGNNVNYLTWDADTLVAWTDFSESALQRSGSGYVAAKFATQETFALPAGAGPNLWIPTYEPLELVVAATTANGYDFFSCTPDSKTCTKFISDTPVTVQNVDPAHLIVTVQEPGASTTSLRTYAYDGTMEDLGVHSPSNFLTFDREMFAFVDGSELWVHRYGNPDDTAAPLLEVPGTSAAVLDDGRMVVASPSSDGLTSELRAVSIGTSGAATSTLFASHAASDGNFLLTHYFPSGRAPGWLYFDAGLGSVGPLQYLGPSATAPLELGEGVHDGNISPDGSTVAFRAGLRPTGDLYEQQFLGMGELRTLSTYAPAVEPVLGQATFAYQFTGLSTLAGVRVHSQHPWSGQDGLYVKAPPPER